MKKTSSRRVGFTRRMISRAGLTSTLAISGLVFANPAFATPATPPSAGPRYVSWALPGNTATTVVWNAPLTNTGGTITGYEIDVTVGASSGTCSAPADTYYCTITGLQNDGSPVTVSAYSLSGASKSPSSNFWFWQPSAGRPYPSTGVTWTQDGASVAVDWTNPTNFGTIGKARNLYSIVYAFPKGQPISTGIGTTAPQCTSAPSASTCRFADGALTPGVTYNFLIRTFNNNVGSVLSDASADYEAKTVPGQLMGSGPGLTASTTGTTPSITVSWSAWGSLGAPAINDGTGGSISSYKVLVWGTPYSFTPAEAGCDVLTTCSVTFDNSGVGGTNAGIAYGKFYRPVVLAVNAQGDGLYSYPPTQVFPGHAPSTPAGLAIQKTSATSLRALWSFSTPSSSNGGWQIQKYTVNVYDSLNNLVKTQDLAGNQRLLSVTGLTPATTYYFTVQAFSANSYSSGVATSGNLSL